MSDSVKKYHELVEDGIIDPNLELEDRPYIYESPDGGKSVYRRKFNSLENRELITSGSYTELELVETVADLARQFENSSPKLLLALAKDNPKFKILISHGHDDHLDDEWLSLFPKDVTIIIPEYKSKGFLSRLKKLGLTNINEASNDGLQSDIFKIKSYMIPYI